MTTKTNRVTFAIHPVERETAPLPTQSIQLAVKALIGSAVEACCDYTTECVRKVGVHPLIEAAHIAFGKHRPLVLSPDMIWITVVQGVAQHVKNHSERFRHLLVGHERKLRISIYRDDIHKGSPENAWDEVIQQFSRPVRDHLRMRFDAFMPDFSTTGPLERIACEVALLDMLQPYLEYRLVGICGIPEVTLEGTTDDWLRLRDQLDQFAPFELDWWLPQVREIADQFVRASAGDVDLSFWQNIYKQIDAYGYTNANG